MTCVVLFNLTRLEGIPRATPIIHALILATGLITARTFARVFEKDRSGARKAHVDVEHIVMIGSNRLSSLYIKMLEAYAPNRHRIIAVLDDRPQMFGRAIEGVRIVGHPQELTSIIDEFAVHGIRTDRVIIGGEADLLSAEALEEVQRVCNQREIGLDFVPGLIGLSGFQATVTESGPETQSEIETEGSTSSFVPPASFIPSAYFRVRRLIDFFAALMLIVLLLPLFIGVSVLVLLDVGSPAFFWQQRIGLCRRTFLLYKFRTLQPPFDWRGQSVPEDRRLSRIGRLLRDTSLDELPQLLNVLVGDMSLIGPRPLLPEDQPSNPTARLMVRPGITGWAQVNGAKLLTPEDKNRLDEWYIRNASPWLDLRIIFMTLEFALRGRRRDEDVSSNANSAQPQQLEQWRQNLALAKRDTHRPASPVRDSAFAQSTAERHSQPAKITSRV
jgi:lipopolysaccharide/colanic/teichoic acid biosynthesis glycosyltransferase